MWWRRFESSLEVIPVGGFQFYSLFADFALTFHFLFYGVTASSSSDRADLMQPLSLALLPPPRLSSFSSLRSFPKKNQATPSS